MTVEIAWTRSLAEVISEKRLDAEHFDPAYVLIEEAIRAGGQAKQLGSLISYCRRGQQPEYVPGGEVLVLNSEHVGEHFINLDGAERSSVEYWARKPNAQTRKFDILLNSTGVGTIGRVNCVLHDAPTVVDNHITIVRVWPGSVDPVYLAVFLNSPLGREQTYKWQSGSSGQLEIYPDDIRQFWIVVPDVSAQRDVRTRFESAYRAYRRAAVDASAAEGSVLGLVYPK